MPGPRFLLIGAGSRGFAYAEAITYTTHPNGFIHAVADPIPFKRREIGRQFIWGAGPRRKGQEFESWQAWLEYEEDRRERIKHTRPKEIEDFGVQGVLICSLDETHVDILRAIAHLNLHVLCEKPLALSVDDCLDVWRLFLSPSSSSSSSSSTAKQPAKPKAIFSIGHVLRYSPHNLLLRKMLLVDRVIGDVVSIEHCEPVGWWHFSHSYVRGNWRRETAAGDGSLLTKSCHDIDFLMWLLCYPVYTNTEAGSESNSTSTQTHTNPNSNTNTVHHYPRKIFSTGNLTQFRKANKPAAAGPATNCLSCPAEKTCLYSAPKIYNAMQLAHRELEWPVNVVAPDIEDVVRDAVRRTDQTQNRKMGLWNNYYLTQKIADGSESSREAMQVAERYLLDKLREDYDENAGDEVVKSRPWYGRCVYESDNNVVDDQVVVMTWDDDDKKTQGHGNGNSSGRHKKTATFHMTAPTEAQCVRRGRIYGTAGEITYDSRTISVYDFATQRTTTTEVPRQPPEQEKAHGGGDYGLARSFVMAVDKVYNEGWGVEEAQRAFVGCTLEEMVVSHGVVFAAEVARREERVVDWGVWWGEKLKGAGID